MNNAEKEATFSYRLSGRAVSSGIGKLGQVRDPVTSKVWPWGHLGDSAQSWSHDLDEASVL